MPRPRMLERTVPSTRQSDEMPFRPQAAIYIVVAALLLVVMAGIVLAVWWWNESAFDRQVQRWGNARADRKSRM